MANAPRGPKLINQDSVVKERPRTAADVIAQSAENRSRGGKGKTGRPSAAEPMKNIGVSLPESIIKALDELAAERTGKNRSMAVVEVLKGNLKLTIK